MTDQLTQQFHLSPATLSIVMTSLPIGALFGALLGGTLAHQFGRKRILSIALLTLTVTSLGAALAPNVIILIICRCIMGFAIGMDSPVAFTFIAEISNLKHKGRNVNYWQVVWYVAIVTSALVVIAFFMLGLVHICGDMQLDLVHLLLLSCTSYELNIYTKVRHG